MLWYIVQISHETGHDFTGAKCRRAEVYLLQILFPLTQGPVLINYMLPCVCLVYNVAINQ